MNAKEVIKLKERLRFRRATYERIWMEADRYCGSGYENMSDPLQFTRKISGGLETTQFQYSVKPKLEIRKHIAVILSYVIPQNAIYHKLVVDQYELMQDSDVRRWLDTANSVLFQMRNKAHSMFYSQVSEALIEAITKGTGIIFAEEILGTNYIRYQHIPLVQMYLGDDGRGEINTAVRSFSLTAEQAVINYGKDNVSEELIKKAENEQTCNDLMPFIHAVKPHDYMAGHWESTLVDEKNKHVISTGIFYSFPFAIIRPSVRGGETYGWSINLDLLPHIRTLNQAVKGHMAVAELTSFPPMVASDSYRGTLIWKSATVNYGGLDINGKHKILPMEINGNYQVSKDLLDDMGRHVSEAYGNQLLLSDRDHMEISATEAQIRAEEKGLLLTPLLSSMQSAFLSTLVDRELDLVFRINDIDRILPDMPLALIEYLRRGNRFKLHFSAPLNYSQKLGEVTAMAKYLEFQAGVTAIQPESVLRFDGDMASLIAMRDLGVPEAVIRSTAEVDALKQLSEQQQQEQQAIESSPLVAQAANDLAQAQATQQGLAQPQIQF